MITEDYCSFEVAKLLKDKGFNEPCVYVYRHDKSEDIWDADKEDIACQKPTHQMAIKWLREEKNIIVNVWYDGGDWNAEYYNNNKDENFHLITCLCNSYEEAVEAALKYALKNLI